MIGPFGDASKYISATNITAEKNVLYTDGDSTKISIVLVDINKSPLEGLKVSFSTDIGKITEYDITDSTGTAEAVFISDEKTGETKIIANTGIKSFEIPIEVIKYEPATIELSAESLVLLADGNDYTKITAIPRNEDGNVMENMAIEFSTDLGTLSSAEGSSGNLTVLPANSGESGDGAVVYLRSSTSGGMATVIAKSGEKSSKPLEIYFNLETPAYILLDANPDIILANGSSKSVISATVLDDDGIGMEGIAVAFTTTLGDMMFPVRTTDANGIAIDTLIGSTDEGTAIVTAEAHHISSTVNVEFTLDIPHQIDVSAFPDRIIADGSAESIITAIARDEDGNAMEGIDVRFKTDLGSSSLDKFKETTDADGKAEVKLTGTAEGIATVTASVSSVEATTSVTFYEYNPASILFTAPQSSDNSILADGASKIDISARILDPDDKGIAGAVVDFSTNYGNLDKTTGVIANQDGVATVTLTSEGSTYDLPVWVKANVQGTSLSDSVAITFRGIVMTTYVDSTKFVAGGYYNVYIRTTLIEYTLGTIVEETAVVFGTTIGEMLPSVASVNEFGEAKSVLRAEVTGAQQSGLIITTKLPSTAVVSKQTDSMTIPGVETLISTIDDEIMGDGLSFALLRGALRETTGKAIKDVPVSWETTIGTIGGEVVTDSTGHSMVTLTVENSVGSNTNATITTSFGSNVSASETITIAAPVNANRLILGFEPDTTGHGFVPCDIDTSIGTRDMGITAHFVNASGNGIDGQAITFSVVPNNLAAICSTATTIGAENGRATVMMAYPPQNAGQIVRVWGEAPDGTRGNIDVILYKEEEEEEESGA